MPGVARGGVTRENPPTSHKQQVRREGGGELGGNKNKKNGKCPTYYIQLRTVRRCIGSSLRNKRLLVGGSRKVESGAQDAGELQGGL